MIEEETCTMCNTNNTVEHYITECKNHETERDELKLILNTHKKVLNIKNTLDINTSTEITKAIKRFIIKTKKEI